MASAKYVGQSKYFSIPNIDGQCHALTDFSPRKHLLNRGGEAWILRMPAVNLCNLNLLNSFISNSLNLTHNPTRAMILQKNCPIFSNHVTFDSATHVVVCPESMARQSRTVPSAQEIRAKYGLVDACFILRRCYIYLILSISAMKEHFDSFVEWGIWMEYIGARMRSNPWIPLILWPSGAFTTSEGTELDC